MTDPTASELCECERWRDGATTCPVHGTTKPPRTWSMPAIPDDVNHLTAVGGDLLIDREEGVRDSWHVTSRASGRVLAMLNTGEILRRYSPLTEATAAAYLEAQGATP